LTSNKVVISLAIMLRCAGRIATISALCLSIGLHWIALQSLAWTTMVIDYSRHAPLCRAIAQTFDGAHPCSLCHVVSKGKNSEKKQDLRSSVSKIDMICAPLANRIESPVAPFEYAIRDCFSFELGHSPPVPPPRSPFFLVRA
jgi:hypothetical protein